MTAGYVNGKHQRKLQIMRSHALCNQLWSQKWRKKNENQSFVILAVMNLAGGEWMICIHITGSGMINWRMNEQTDDATK